MAEQSLEHSIATDRISSIHTSTIQQKIVSDKLTVVTRGQDRAFACVVLFCMVAVAFGFLNLPWLAGGTLLTSMTYIVYAFLTRNPKPPRQPKESPKSSEE